VDAIDTPNGPDNTRVVHLSDVTEKMGNYQIARKFHTSVAHKLRTPASTIYSSLEMLNSKIDQISPDEIKSLAEIAWHGAKRLVGALKDILSYLDAPLASQTGDSATLEELPGLITKVSESLGLEGAHLTLPVGLYSTKISLTVYALELILTELFENSQKFHPQKTPRIEVRVERTDAHSICFSIIDDGLTLTAEQLSWAWLPYFQGEKNFSGEVPGMGLGFPTVATLAWQAGGDIHLSNCPAGPGVVVELTIPVIRSE
jgi:K+-sensing histidine kinase KdpD